MSYVEGTLSTKVGEARFTLVTPDHVCLTTDVYLTTGPINVERSTAATVRGRLYHTQIHFYLDESGQWVTRDRPYVKKFNYSNDPASDKAADAIVTAYREAWVAYIPQHPELTRQSHFDEAQRTTERLQSKVQEARKALDKAEADLTQHRKDMIARAARLA